MPVILSQGEKLKDGHYTVIREIGVGGMGVVYHCRDEYLLRDVAIKMLLPELVDDHKSLEIFRQEARLAAQLEHPNIVTIYDIGTEKRSGKTHHYLSMEYLPGGNLAHRVTEGPISIEHCLNWMKQLASGLNVAHKRGVIHQDIKADNIFITTEGDLKIGDFGLARLLVGRVQYNAAMRGMGTPAYMSPELCRGETQDYRSDIYSLGILFFEMATGQLPFQARGMVEMAMKHSNAPAPSLRRINPEIPEILEHMIRRMLAKKPDERYQTMSDVVTILDELLFELRVAKLDPDNQTILTDETTITKRDNGGRASSGALIADLGDANYYQDLETLKLGGGLVSNEGSPKQTRAPRQGVLERSSSLKTQGFKVVDLCWSFKTNGPIGWSSMPVIDKDEKTLFVASADQNLYALTVEAGEKIWSYKAKSPFLASPLSYKDKLIATSSGGDIVLLLASNGVPFWSFKTGKTLVATPTLHKDLLIVPSMDGKLQAIDLTRGDVKWEYAGDEPIVVSPQLHANQLFFATKGGTFCSLSLETGKTIWSFQADGPIVSGSAMSADNLYFGTQTGMLYAVEAESGHLIWDYATEEAITSRGVVVFTSVIFSSQDKWMYCCEKYSGALQWKAPLKGSSISNLVAFRNSILSVSREGWLHCISGKTGEMKWQRDLGRCIESTPLVTPKMLFLGTVEGDVLAYAISEIS